MLMSWKKPALGIATLGSVPSLGYVLRESGGSESGEACHLLDGARKGGKLTGTRLQDSLAPISVSDIRPMRAALSGIKTSLHGLSNTLIENGAVGVTKKRLPTEC